ncbi:MAG: DNA polymerase I, partial [Deltaproteobacteria bacterium]|nr:DNA polymerase I [Deltaproteobacteria bacterium]
MRMPKSHPKLFVIDASSLIFRAFYAIRSLSTSKGFPTNAIYGFTTMLLGVLEKHKPDYVACVFDTPKPTFRKELYPDYKAHRGPPPDDLIPQFDHIHRVVEAMGLQKLAEEGYEADDIIATLVKCFPKCDVTIVTGDKDLMQLVGERVVVLDTMKDITYGPKEVEEKLGVPPELVTDYLGLIGDTSDNIPGVPGIGPKTATKLIHEYGSMEKVLAAAKTEKMKPSKARDALVEHAESARLSKKLATVHPEVGGSCAGLKLESFRAPEAHPASFVAFLQEMEFKTLAKKYADLAGAPAAPTAASPGSEATPTDAARISVSSGTDAAQITLVANEREWHHCLEKLERHEVVAFDTETRGDRTTEIEMVGMSLCGDGKEAFYIPVRHQGDGTADQVPVKKLVADFARLAGGKTIVAQNLKYDYKVLLNEGHELERPRGGFFDTMLAHYLVDPEEKHGLDALAARYLNATVGDFKEVLGERPDFSLVPLSEAARYGALDAWATRNLYEPLAADLRAKGLAKLFDEVEMPTAIVLAHVERNGIAVDRDVLA